MVQPQKPKAEVYPNAIDAIINPTKPLDTAVYHSFYTLHISDIDLDNEMAVVMVRGDTLALLSWVTSTSFVPVRKNDTRRSGFRKGSRPMPLAA